MPIARLRLCAGAGCASIQHSPWRKPWRSRMCISTHCDLLCWLLPPHVPVVPERWPSLATRRYRALSWTRRHTRPCATQMCKASQPRMQSLLPGALTGRHRASTSCYLCAPLFMSHMCSRVPPQDLEMIQSRLRRNRRRAWVVPCAIDLDTCAASTCGLASQQISRLSAVG